MRHPRRYAGDRGVGLRDDDQFSAAVGEPLNYRHGYAAAGKERIVDPLSTACLRAVVRCFEEQLNGAQIGAGLQQMDRECVAQGMRGDRFAETNCSSACLHAISTAHAVMGCSGRSPGNSHPLWTARLPVGP